MSFNTRYTALFAGAALLTLSGCSSMHSGKKMSDNDASASSTNSGALSMREKMLSKQEADLAKREQMLQQKEMKMANVNSASNGGHMANASGSELLPPNPQAGQCYARLLIPAKYETVTEKVLKRQAASRIETVPAKLGWEEQTVEVKPATTKLEIVPATYETVTERIMVKPATSRLIEVPAQYEKVTERVLDKAKHTMWKRTNSAVSGALDTRIDSSTGDIMCLIEVPATYKTITKTLLKTPATVKEVPVAAEYKTVTRTVVKTPATTREKTIPAQFKTVKVQKVIQPASSRELSIPAEYTTVTQQKVVSAERLSWNSVLCDVNMTSSVVSDMQTRLKSQGYYKGNVDGRFGPATIKAVNDFAKSKGMPQGRNFVTVDTAEALDIDY